MRINIFEGARRIALLFGGVIAVGITGFAVFDTVYVPIHYVVSGPGSSPVRASIQACGQNDGLEYVYKTTPKGTEIRAAICFRAYKGENGEWGIPYRRHETEKGMWWLAPSYSSAVSSHMRSVKEAFEIPQSDLDYADSRYWSERWQKIREAAPWLGGSLLALWVTTFVVGWIVRGFAGIPMGKDTREEDERRRVPTAKH